MLQLNPGVSRQKQHCCAGTTTLLSRSGPLWLLFVSHTHENHKKSHFQNSEAIKTAVTRAPSDPKILPGMRRRVTEEIEKVHPRPRLF